MLFLGNGNKSEEQALDLITQLKDAIGQLSAYQQMCMLGPDLQGSSKEERDSIKNDIHMIRNQIYNALTVEGRELNFHKDVIIDPLTVSPTERKYNK